jgi:oligopeptide/dipeptide ABC transporter ATP-binding protein
MGGRHRHGPAIAVAHGPVVVTAPATRAGFDAILRVRDLQTHFKVRRKRGFGSDTLPAVDGVSFAIRRGETLGLVGESGCGKSTLGRTILGLHEPVGGSVRLDGHELVGLGRRRRRPLCKRMQVVFQDPFASLDPRMTIHEIVAEPLRINGVYSPARVAEMIACVGLGEDAAQRRPAEFSGGQRQRIAIARALALGPDVMILDEAVSALDVSIQAQIVNLLMRLQREMGLAYLFISHDLSVVRHISHQVAVMYLGRIVEIGGRDQVFGAPAHPYTQSLLSAKPSPDPARRGARRRIMLRGDPPNPLAPPSGCAFRTRCFKAQARCEIERPDLTARTGPDHFSACHFAGPADAGAKTFLEASDHAAR